MEISLVKMRRKIFEVRLKFYFLNEDKFLSGEKLSLKNRKPPIVPSYIINFLNKEAGFQLKESDIVTNYGYPNNRLIIIDGITLDSDKIEKGWANFILKNVLPILISIKRTSF